MISEKFKMSPAMSKRMSLRKSIQGNSTQWVLLALGVLLTAVTPASAGQLTVKTETVFYEFSGKSLREMNQAMYNATPILTDGQKYQGSTHGKFRYGYEYDLQDGKCGAKSPYVKLFQTYTLPKWVNYELASKQVQKEWDRYYGALVEHEKGHTELNRAKGARILAVIPMVEPQSSCSILHRLVVKKVRTITSDTADHDKYDADTNHGETEGVRLRVPAKPSVLTRLWAWISG